MGKKAKVKQIIMISTQAEKLPIYYLSPKIITMAVVGLERAAVAIVKSSIDKI
jgi:hypothetical protein